MRYIINYQVKILYIDFTTNVIRSSYTMLEEEVKKNNLFDFIKVENWFKRLFLLEPLYYFIDTLIFNKSISCSEVKIGRITNSLSGKYKTF